MFEIYLIIFCYSSQIHYAIPLDQQFIIPVKLSFLYICQPDSKCLKFLVKPAVIH